MNKLIRLGVVLLTASVLTACTGFRVNMTRKYSATHPAQPAPPHHAPAWVDVLAWQKFLVEKHMLGAFTPNVFDEATVKATRKFQRVPGGDAWYALPETDCVNLATFMKAKQEGFKGYTPVATEDQCASAKATASHGHRHRAMGGVGTLARDTFRDNTLHLNCTDGTFGDVSDWQRFLIANAYLSKSNCTMGVFGSTTQLATMAFQNAYGLPQTGYVNPATWAKADKFSVVTGGLGKSLVGADNNPTVESRTNCGN